MTKILKRVVPIAILIALVIGWVSYKKSQASKAVREQAVVLVQAFPLYQENKAYYDSAFVELHDLAFDQAYKPGGRRVAASFDEERYHTMLIGLYHRKATEDGKMELADALEGLRKNLGLQVVQFE